MQEGNQLRLSKSANRYNENRLLAKLTSNADAAKVVARISRQGWMEREGLCQVAGKHRSSSNTQKNRTSGVQWSQKDKAER
jgi:hypothetical protein